MIRPHELSGIPTIGTTGPVSSQLANGWDHNRRTEETKKPWQFHLGSKDLCLSCRLLQKDEPLDVAKKHALFRRYSHPIKVNAAR